MDKDIRISVKAVLYTILLLAGVWFVVQIQGVILALFIALILALGLTPFVDYLESKNLQRGFSVFITVILTLGGVFGLVYIALAPMVEQTRTLLEQLPDLIATISSAPWTEAYLERFGTVDGELIDQFSTTSSGVIRATLGAFSGFLSVLTIIVFTIYLLLEFNLIKDQFSKLLGKKDHHKQKLEKMIEEIEHKLGAWLRGQISLMVIVGFLTFFGLSLLKVEYALSLSLIAGLLEIIPNFGPILSAIPAALVGFSMSNITGLGVVGLFIIVQQIENNLIVPKVMQKAVGFNPLLTIIIVIIGGKLFGLMGIVLAIPFTSAVGTVVKHVLAGDL